MNDLIMLHEAVLEALKEVSTEYLRNFCVSDVTQKHLNDLSGAPVELAEVEYDQRRKTLQIAVFVKSSTNKEFVSYIASNDVPEAPNGWYTVMFKWFNVRLRNYNEQEIWHAMLTNDVQVFEDDPSFYYQGSWESLVSIRANMFKFTGEKGTGKWEKIHSVGTKGPHISKHIAYAIDNFKQLLPKIVEQLTSPSF